MIIRRVPASDYIQSELIWFLEVEYHGQLHRFATITMNLEDNDGKSYNYFGSLEAVEITQEMGTVNQITTQEDSVAIAVTFPNRNLSKEIFNGKVLDGMRASLGFVLVRHGQIQNNYDERTIVYTGTVSGPVYGYPDNDLGYVEFSIENRSIFTDVPLLQKLLGSNLYIEDVSITPNPNIGQTSPFPVLDNIVNVSNIHRGKTIPLVFGELDGILRENNSKTDIPISPAYVIAYDTTGVKPLYYVIAGHATNATSVKVFDNAGNTDTANVSSFVNIDNRTFSYISLNQTSPISQSVAPNNDRQVWVMWNNGAPYVNPFNTGDLKGGGDICLYLLSQITDTIDYHEWAALLPILNSYVFGGYINDDKITIFQFLQQNIVKYLPISIVNGPNGLKPVLDLFLDGAQLKPRAKITAGPQFFRTGPISTMNTSEDIINHVVVRYGYNGVTENTSARFVVSNKPSEIPYLGSSVSSDSESSINKFGERPKVITLDYCYDWRTASRIAQNIITGNCYLIQTISYNASVDFGYLEIGDIIELTDDEMGFSELKCQIISKTFVDDSWIIKMKLDNKPNRIRKTDV